MKKSLPSSSFVFKDKGTPVQKETKVVGRKYPSAEKNVKVGQRPPLPKSR